MGVSTQSTWAPCLKKATTWQWQWASLPKPSKHALRSTLEISGLSSFASDVGNVTEHFSWGVCDAKEEKALVKLDPATGTLAMIRLSMHECSQNVGGFFVDGAFHHLEITYEFHRITPLNNAARKQCESRVSE